MRGFTRHRSVGREGRQVDRSAMAIADRSFVHADAVVADGDDDNHGSGGRCEDAKGRSFGRHTIDR